MKKIIITIIAILTALIIFTPRTASNTSLPADEEPSLRKPAIEQATTTKTYYETAPEGLADEKRYKAELRAIATAKGLSETKISEIEDTIGGDGINEVCPNGESTWNPGAVGDNGTSFGIVQIHLPAHPNVTKEQALDPTFALNFIVDEFIKGNEWKWTCWKEIHGNG